MNKKDAYYFSHDSNAQDDPKCMLLIDQMGMEGYGIFWALIERLRNEANFRLPLVICNAFAKRWGTSREKVETVIKNYDLFIVEGNFFYSNRLQNSMNEKSEKARISASYRWGNANALHPHSNRNANGMQKDANKRKEKKIKKEVFGVSFSADLSSVNLNDGTTQLLGQWQQQRVKEEGYLPHYIKKGIIE